jgi:hypothetical protein
MLEFDHSAGRGEMHAEALFVFEHTDSLGNAPSHHLFRLVPKPYRLPDPARPGEKIIPRDISHYAFASLPEDGKSLPDFPRVRFHAILNNIAVKEPETA